jgi:tight adherence protein B
MLLPVVLVFILGAGAVLGVYAAVMYLPGMLERRRLERRLLDLSSPVDEPSAEQNSVLARPTEGPLPVIDRMVSQSRAGSSLTRLIEQSGVRTTASAIALLSFVFAFAAAVVAAVFTTVPYLPLLAGAFAGMLPTAFLFRCRSKRMGVFEERFPEALDLMSRALRAGHGFQAAMGMIADEMKEPIGPEFRKAFDQQNFGLPLREALMQLAERVPLLDVRFFVTAVLIQRDTGGNLSEILDNLAHVVRERFKVLRQVRVHTAHGRFTGFVLLGLPPVLAVLLSMLNPEHMEPLFREPMGQSMLIVGIVMQAIGFVWIRKVIKIEV